MSGARIQKHNDEVYFTFGRFQPPTVGHELVIRTLERLGKDSGADIYVFASSSQNDMDSLVKRKNFRTLTSKNGFKSIKLNENPLSIEQKVRILEKMYDVPIINTTRWECRDPYRALARLEEAGYKRGNIHMVVGGDRVEAFSKLGIDVISAGERAANPISGTKMRLAAVQNDFDTFKSGISVGRITEADAKQIMNEVRVGLGFEPVTGGGKNLGKGPKYNRHVSKRRGHLAAMRSGYPGVQLRARSISETRRRRH